MDIKGILYVLPPKTTARIISFVLSFVIVLTGARIAIAFENDKTTKQVTDEEPLVGEESKDGQEEKPSTEVKRKELKVEGAASVGTVISAGSAILCDLKNSTVLAEKNMDASIAMREMSIFMTLIVSVKAINDGKVDINEYTVCPASAARSEGYHLSSDVLPIGKRMKIGDLMRCMIYQQGSAFAYTLAVHISGSEESFVAKMNEEAKAMGLNATNFANCTGDQNASGKTSAYDLAVIMKYLFKDPILKQMLCSSEPLTVGYGSGSSVQLVVRNEFFENYCTESQAKLDGIIGGKINTLAQSGWAVIAFNNGESDHVAIIIDSKTPFSDALMLYSAFALA